MSVATQTAAALFHPGFGARLRMAREALGLSSAVVAAKLKLGERQIEAIEAEEFSLLPGETFVRGFVRNYARLVNVGADELIRPLDIHSVVSEVVTAPSEGVAFPSHGLRRWVLLPLLAVGFFVLLVAVLYYWLRQGEDTQVGEPPVAVAPVPLARAPLPPPTPAAMPMMPMMPVPPLPAATPLPPADTAPTMPANVLASATTTPPAPTTPVPATPVAAVPAAIPVAAVKGHALRFAPALDSWIQVVDGKGKHFSKLVHAGSVEVFSGEPPFKLVVGEAAQMALSYDGHQIDLAPFIGQKVARLTLE